MLKSLHIWGAYAFVALFLFSVVLGAYSLAKRREDLTRLSAWGFLVSFIVLLGPYFGALVMKIDILSQHPGAPIPTLEKHHNMSKFVFTGVTLMAVATGVVLQRFKDKPLPNWFLPNMLFLSFMVIGFIMRSLISAYRLGAVLN